MSDITLQTCQKAARELKSLLNPIFTRSGTYKTTSSWSSVKYVELTWGLVNMFDDAGNPAIGTIDYDASEVEAIFDRVCEKYNIYDGQRSIDLRDHKVVINLYSTEPANKVSLRN